MAPLTYNLPLTLAAFCIALTIVSQASLAMSSGRVNMDQTRQSNQYFLNEVCDLDSRTLRGAKKLNDTLSLFLTSKKNSLSSARVQTKPQPLSSVSFGLGNHQSPQAVIKKKLNCSINIVPPSYSGILVTINSVNLPKNLTKLSITLSHNSSYTEHIPIDGNRPNNYVLTQPGNSRIGIHLQSFQPIDWSTLSFDILFTVYRRGNNTSCPSKNWFDCGDNICVPSSLVCDNNRNCPNGRDEELSYSCFAPLIWSLVFSLTLAMILIFLAICVILVVRRRRFANGANVAGGYCGQHYDDDGEKFSSVFETDGLDNNSSSRIDLTLETAALHNGFLANNVYAGGFENPIWTDGTLTKQHHRQHQHNDTTPTRIR